MVVTSVQASITCPATIYGTRLLAYSTHLTTIAHAEPGCSHPGERGHPSSIGNLYPLWRMTGGTLPSLDPVLPGCGTGPFKVPDDFIPHDIDHDHGTSGKAISGR